MAKRTNSRKFGAKTPSEPEPDAKAPTGSGGGRLRRAIPGMRSEVVDPLKVPRGQVAKSPPAPKERNERGFIDQPSGLECCQRSHEDAPQRQVCVAPEGDKATCDRVLIPLPLDERRIKAGREPLDAVIPDLK